MRRSRTAGALIVAALMGGPLPARAAQPVAPTISASITVRGQAKTHLEGTAAPGARVDIYAKIGGARTFTLRGHRIASAKGHWKAGTTIAQNSSFYAVSQGQRSSTAGTYVQAFARASMRALGEGRVRVVLHGFPEVTGWANIYQGSRRIGHVRTTSSGDADFVVTASPGRRTLDVWFAPPHTYLLHGSETIAVR